MPTKIRLMRIGSKKRPFYRVVAVDERRKRTGKYLDLIGTYNPLTEPKEIILNQEKLNQWKKNGAVLSDGFLRIIKEAPQKPPRKPKRERDEKPAAQPTAAAEAPQEEAAPAEETENAAATEQASENPTDETGTQSES